MHLPLRFPAWLVVNYFLLWNGRQYWLPGPTTHQAASCPYLVLFPSNTWRKGSHSHFIGMSRAINFRYLITFIMSPLHRWCQTTPTMFLSVVHAAGFTVSLQSSCNAWVPMTSRYEPLSWAYINLLPWLRTVSLLLLSFPKCPLLSSFFIKSSHAHFALLPDTLMALKSSSHVATKHFKNPKPAKPVGPPQGSGNAKLAEVPTKAQRYDGFSWRSAVTLGKLKSLKMKYKVPVIVDCGM